ncbi:MAG: hypothetical protein IKP88_21805 [Lachnospiraceae bacterium]|nr:hypothetical protein [Lachnospiraceae bacterium]
MSDLIGYAKNELYLLRDGEEDEMQDLVEKNILELIEVFSKQGHSGFSGNYVLSIFDRLVRYLPITPLTGDDDEWNKCFSKSNFFQNKRCSRVFKDSDGPYDSCVRTFSDDSGETFYQSRDSRESIEFPYYPPTYPKQIILENRELEDYEDD